jgi:hypothetical protein
MNKCNPSPNDQLTNQPSNQGRLPHAVALNGVTKSLCQQTMSFGPSRGRGITNSTKSQGAGVPVSGSPVKGSKSIEIKRGKRRTEYPRRLRKLRQFNILQGGVTKP